MATASVTKAQADKPIQTQTAVDVSAPTRREFLYYIWSASIALVVGEATAGLIWFALPRFRAGEFGGIFTYLAKDLPEQGAARAHRRSARGEQRGRSAQARRSDAEALRPEGLKGDPLHTIGKKTRNRVP